MEIALVTGDITEQEVDAVVNAANGSLLGGGGVDGAIHRRGGPEILEACRRLRATAYPDGLPTGEAVATTAGRLPARWVIHTVGPVYSGAPEDGRLLASCHAASLRVADELGARSVAFPAISTGVYGYPLEEAAPIAVNAVRDTDTRVELVRFVLFDERALEAYERAMVDPAVRRPVGTLSPLPMSDDAADLTTSTGLAEHLDEVQIVDCREPYEWVAGHIEGSVHVPLNSILAGATGSLDDTKTTVVVCRSGNRSELASLMLQARGFQTHNLERGLEGWHAEGRPLVTDDGQPGRVA